MRINIEEKPMEEKIMSMNFAEQLKKATSFTYTENGATCLSSTGNGLVDLFGTIGALRKASDDRKVEMFDRAVAENKELAAKILFYGRDIREGLGERDTFRTLLAYAADRYKEVVVPNIPLIGFYGRFDDLYCLINTGCEAEMWSAMKDQFVKDLDNMKAGKPCSLLAKWIKTPDASSKNTRKLGILTSQKLGYKNVAEFKKDLKALRKYLDIVEIKVSANSIDTIAYEKVPSNAMMKYRNVFNTKDADRFAQYLEDVKSGKKEIKAGTLYPYDIVQKMLVGHEKNDVLEAQWNALPNYVEDGTNILVMADVSGSMTTCNSLPLASSIGLAMYFAERATGAFHNLFMTFSSRPEMVSIHGAKLSDRIRNINRAHWEMNTNLDKAFELILNTAVKAHTPAEELPKALVIISDMQIDAYGGCVDISTTFYDKWSKAFADAGYSIPNVIFWNVNSTSDAFHADVNHKGVQLLSGHSVSTFKTLIDNLDKTPVEAMLSVILSERYAAVTVAA